MKRSLIFQTILWLIFTSFFWNETEEKQLKSLLQTAESAIKKEEYTQAKQAYQELITRCGVNTAQKYAVDWPTYVDIVLRYALLCESLGDLEEGQEALSQLLLSSPPQEQLPRIKLMKARFTSTRNSPGEAFKDMLGIANIHPLEQWSKEDISFYHALQFALDSHYDELIHKAKRYLVTGYYEEAIDLYKEILTAIEKGHYPKASSDISLQKKIRYRLAESYYSQANYEQTLALCYNGMANEDRIDREMIYLAALCYHEKKEYEKSLEFFQNYTSLGSNENLDHYEHALFEIGYFHYKAANFIKARTHFEKLQNSKSKPARIAVLYLAKIYLKESQPEKVEKVLQPLLALLSEEDFLRYECYYLSAEAAYVLGNYEMAKEFYKKSLPDQIQAEWSCQALYHLGWCYTKLAKMNAEPTFFSKAEEIFEGLLHTNEKESAALALGRVYLLMGENASARVETLLAPFEHSIQALLLRAEAAQNYEQKEEILKYATEPQFYLDPFYADAWYERGLNQFQEGLKDPINHRGCFEKAASFLSHSFNALTEQKSKKAAQILKLQAKASAYRNSPISSLVLLDKLLCEFHESSEEREETLYLKGLIATRIMDETYFPIAEEALLQAAEHKGKYYENALYVLATLYYGRENYEKAKEVFLQIAHTAPTYIYASEGWFWAAEAAEKLGLAEHLILRSYVYQNYPLSPKAAEAYFRQYSYQEYLLGQTHAWNHLHSFPERFPSSPLLVVVYYLLGMNEDNFESAKFFFEEAIKSFSLCVQENTIPDTAFIYFRYQAMLECAHQHMKKGFYPQALYLLDTIVSDFSTPNHYFASQLMKKTPYPSVYEEAEFTLAEIYLKIGKKYRAQERLAKMLSHYEQAGIKEGYFLSQVWKEQGRLAHLCHDYDTALNCFGIAEECGKGYLSDELKLSLWLLQSHAYRGKKEYDSAMKLLSKVINSDIASPLRLKAMFYRAEVYELQGRPELAIRQLEAMAKKGGDWAMQAAEKLKEYGM